MTLGKSHIILSMAIIAVFFSCKKSGSTGASVPSIHSISPTFGPDGTVDTISGAGFSLVAARDSVYFNGKLVTVVSANATRIIVNVPAQAGTGKVSVTINGNTATGPVFTSTGVSSYIVSTFAGSGTAGLTDAAGTAASFWNPAGVAVDSSGNVYVADCGNNEIRKITPAGVVSTLAGSGSQGAVDGTGTAASFYHPYGVAVDGSGNVYVADGGNNEIRKITPAGVVSTLAGSGSQGAANGAGTAASFYGPYGVAVDKTGNVYVADGGNSEIRMITPAGVVSTFAGSGSYGLSDGTGMAASFFLPSGLCLDGSGYIYVADNGNSLIRKITPAAVVTTLAGDDKSDSTDGLGAAAGFWNPFSVAVDGSGFVYVADFGNQTIRKITPSGLVITIAGIVGITGAADGPGRSATFSSPSGVAVDANGNIYVADLSNNKIRKLTPQ